VIHVLCDCGALASSPPLPGAGSVPCRACGKAIPIPDAGDLGIDAGAAPAPVPVPPQGPRFDADERLDLRALESEAARLLVTGRLVLAGGLLGAGAAAVLPGPGAEVRVLAGAAALFAAIAGWTLFRGARASCLAAVSLAQRQREILRRLA
jgi:hypothetical protein